MTGNRIVGRVTEYRAPSLDRMQRGALSACPTTGGQT
jgi:hypothetical protein